MTARLIITLSFLLAGCTTGEGDHFDQPDAGKTERSDTPIRPAVFDVRIEPNTIQVGYDETFELVPVAYDRHGDQIDGVEFELSFDNSIIEPQIANRYRAIEVGKAEFQASAEGIDGFATVVVGAQRVGSIELFVADTNMGIGETTFLDVEPRSVLGGEYRTPELLEIELTSSNPQVADLNDDQRLEAYSVGTTEIVAEAQGVRSRVTVAVFEYDLQSVEILFSFDRLLVGRESRIQSRARWATEPPPSYETTLSSSDPDVVRVEGDVVTAVSTGVATLSARIEGYDETDTFDVEVIDSVDDFALTGSGQLQVITLGALVGEQLGGFAYINQQRDQFVSIDAGFAHTCVFLTEELVSCGGDSSWGQAGLIIGDIIHVPRLILMAGKPTTMRASGNRACARVGDEWRCWGEIDGMARAVPAPVMYGPFDISEMHECSIALDTVSCTGANTSGQIGQGTTSPTATGSVDSVVGALDVAVGADFSCAITATETYCWGEGDDGQLGSLPFVDSSSPRLVDSPHAFVDIEAGTAHACGLTAHGEVYCWGRNDGGQVGDASFQTRGTPVRVDSPHTFKKVDVAGDRSCALTDDHKLFCWGRRGLSESSFPLRVPLKLSNF